MSRRYLFFTVFAGGVTTLAIEFTTSRMLQTIYGTSNIVWANVIGFVLLCLTLGYFVGGRLADRYPRESVFYGLVSAAGFCSVFFLLLLSVLLRQSATHLAAMNVGAIAGSLLAAIVALFVPITLLGCLSPFAIRLGVQDVAEAGRVSGQIYAISTMGSLLGTYLPVLFVIPLAGSRLTAVFFGTFLLIVGLIGWWFTAENRSGRVALFILPVLLIPFVVLWGTGSIKENVNQIYEAETAYNYIEVVRIADCNYLLLNEGQAFHSFYCDGGRVPQVSVWSMMLAAPFFNSPETMAQYETDVDRVAVIGLAAGSIPKQYLRVFPAVEVTGIELDEGIVQAGYDYFDLADERIEVVVGDGRYELNRLDGRYDVITIDAYKVPYIPWHLTTQEFFAEARGKLTERGVLAINVGRVPQDRRLVEALTHTISQVFPTVHTVDVPGTLNTILFATMAPTEFDHVRTALDRLPSERDPLLRQVLQIAVAHEVATVSSDVLFTDERAPVETLIDSLVLRFVLQEGVSNLPRVQVE